MTINVLKRDGKKEPLQLDKLHKMVETACEGLDNVSVAEIESSSGLQFYDGISTSDIQKVLINSASNLISTDAPNYQYVAARLLLFSLVKEVYKENSYPAFKKVINDNVSRGVYDADIFTYYSDKELDQLDFFIDHKRDLDFTFAGMSQLIDKYLVQDRITGEVYETPQIMYMMIAATIFKNYPKNIRLKYVKNFYDAVSLQYISLPTPILAGVRTNKKGFSSCTLISVDDTLDSIGASDLAVLQYTAHRAGIGLDMSKIRGIKSKIRAGEIEHTGVVPFIKKFVATTLSCTQNGIRGGASTIHFPIWHSEIESIIVLKNNKGSEDNRERNADYCIKLSKLFYDRYLKNQDITLFSPHDVPLLNETFGLPEFDEHYVAYENDESIPKTTVIARKLFHELMTERAETGRIYIINMDHANSHGAFNVHLNQTNLCCEVLLPTKPINHIDDEEGRIALCMLSAINMGKFKDTPQSLQKLEKYCDLTVRAIEEIIDLQTYPVKSAEISTKNSRYIGVGVTNLAYYLAKHKVKYQDSEALNVGHRFFEAFQYYLLKSSNTLAKERGACQWFHETKYAKGILPIDTYKRDVDKLTAQPLLLDWEVLREDIKEYGLRNSTLSAQMPCESSSPVTNSTNGVEPPRDYLTVRQSKRNSFPLIVPEYEKLKDYYTLLWEQPSNEGYLNIMAVIQKFLDQSISTNTSYNPSLYPDNEIPMSVFIKDLLQAYKNGLKTLYYHNTMKESHLNSLEIAEEEASCAGGACKL